MSIDSSIKLNDLIKENHGDAVCSSLNRKKMHCNRNAQREALSKVLARNANVKSLKQIIPIAPSSKKKKVYMLKSSTNSLDFSHKFHKAYKVLENYWRKNEIISLKPSLSRDRSHLRTSNIDDMMLTSASNEHEEESEVRIF